MSVSQLKCVNSPNTNSCKLQTLTMYGSKQAAPTNQTVISILTMMTQKFTLVLATSQFDVSLSSSHFLIHSLSHLHCTGSCHISLQAKLQPDHGTYNTSLLPAQHSTNSRKLCCDKIALITTKQLPQSRIEIKPITLLAITLDIYKAACIPIRIKC